MIEASVSTGDLVVGRPTPVTIRFVNSGQGTCFNLGLRLRLPAGLVLVKGSAEVDVSTLPAGRAHPHTILVEARRPGQFALTSSTFSYRDENDRPVRVTDFRVGLVARAAPPAVRIKQPTGRLRVECETGQLHLGAWDMMRVLVSNTTGVPLEEVSVAVAGPFGTDGKRSRIESLADGSTARCTFSVKADEGGQHVPVTVHTTYRYRDLDGGSATGTQRDDVKIAVRAVAPHRDPSSDEQVLLYLAASPRDLPPLRSDLEMRKVKERLQLSRARERFRIEWCPAARFDDLSQALIDYEPHVVHFAGHGDVHGNLCVEDDAGLRDLITPAGLGDLFAQHQATIGCVVVNACHSTDLAKILSERVGYAVGMRTQIGDEAAIQFSVGFYQGRFAGMEVPDAFLRGCTYIRSRVALEQQHLTPLLFHYGRLVFPDQAG
ncbi:CHAT domain-containing protein [Asanoa siamensis]|uniref:CHAT domain-containing protein n=1 Tax=Asanoa siamensis TaxID=926357 RepID=A0ABQ4D4U1_9ACTN|nr:CHAT domain-containing protein [Asanoa siamensis]GIF78555.1 hypothetical protein Asi02nite_80730 [Asanoa siamensis]